MSYNYCKSLSIYYNYNSGDNFLAFVLGLASAVQQGRGGVYPIMVNSTSPGGDYPGVKSTSPGGDYSGVNPTSQRLSLSRGKFYLAGAESLPG